MDAGSLPGWPNVGRASPAMATSAGTCLRCGSPVSCISTVISLLFFLGPICDASRSRRLCARPRLQEEANDLETPRKSIGPSAHMRRREEKVSWLGGGRHCFSLLFTMRVVADRACNHSPKLVRKVTGGAAHQR